MRWIFNSKRWVSTCFNYKIKTSFSNENVVTNPKKGFESEPKGMRTNTPEGFDLEGKSVGACWRLQRKPASQEANRSKLEDTQRWEMTKTSLRSLFLVILCILGPPFGATKKALRDTHKKNYIDSTEVHPHVCNESMSMFVMFKKKL